MKALFRQEHWPKPEREDEDFDHEFDVASSKFVFHTDSNGHLCIRESGASVSYTHLTLPTIE